MGFCGVDYIHIHKAVFVIVVMRSGSNFVNKYKWDPLSKCRGCDRSYTLLIELVLFSCNSCWNRWKL